jgi:aquaporin related protein
VASGLLKALVPGPLTITPALGAGATKAQGVFIEALVTCALVLCVLFLAVEKHKSTFLAPVGIGLTLLAGHLFVSVPLSSISRPHLEIRILTNWFKFNGVKIPAVQAVVFTGASMNTARAFGPAVFTGFESDHWVYW